MPPQTEALFVYGSLRDPEVQMQVMGRLTPGLPDALLGYRKVPLAFPDGSVYPIIEPDAAATVAGELIVVTRDELARIDQYETTAYQRVQVQLESGAWAWVYRAPPPAAG